MSDQCTDTWEEFNITFVMPPIPVYLTVSQRIQRWTKLLSVHPLFGQFFEPVQERLTKENCTQLAADMKKIEVLLRQQMRDYQTGQRPTDLLAPVTLWVEIGQIAADTVAIGLKQCTRDANYALKHFLAGNWGYLTITEWGYIDSAVARETLDQHPESLRPAVMNVASIVDLVRKEFDRSGKRTACYRLEDEENLKIDD